MAVAAAGDDKDDRVGKSTFRWLDAVRYVVSSVVVVLIVTVIVKSIMVVLRPDSFDLYVLRGTVFASKPQHQDDKDKPVLLQFSMTAENPSSRVRLYFTGINAYLLDKNKPESTPYPMADCVVFFSPDDMVVPQTSSIDTIGMVTGYDDPDIMNTTYFQMLYYNASERIDGMTLRVDGNLTTEIRSGYNTSARLTTYFCRQLVVGGDPEDETSNQASVQCASAAEGSSRQ